jgi:hypothetical protein
LTATTTQPSFSANEKLQKTKMSFCWAKINQRFTHHHTPP